MSVNSALLITQKTMHNISLSMFCRYFGAEFISVLSQSQYDLYADDRNY